MRLRGDQNLSAVNFKDVGCIVKAHGDTSGADIAMSLNDGNVHTATISTDAVAITFTNWIATAKKQAILVGLTNGGSQTVTIAGVSTPGSEGLPTFTTSGIDWFIVWTTDAGTTKHFKTITLDSST